ncbi:UDP-glucose 4-epimerase GalE [Alphaproteobacteria bacterium]|nr:UDP-glucose 4-epimerase GalE [Alphaproteobacteria bacterium]
MNKNVIVTGGAGYIGSHACKALKKAGYTPVTIDNLSTGWWEAVKFGPLEIVDLLDQSNLERIFEAYKPNAVMHFAAFSQVSESVIDPAKYWRNNVLGSLNLFQVCASHGCKNVIFSSTCAIYGDHDKIILTENSEQRPVNAYGSSKRAVEEMLQQLSKSVGLKHVIFRYFNVAGADPDGDIGEFHDPETHLIPLILNVIDGRQKEITIFGTDYETPDGTCIRDYVHVCDLIDAHISGLKWLEQGGLNKAFNLGTGSGFSVREVIEHVSLVTDRHVPVVKGERRAGDCTMLVSGSEFARTQLGWEPKRSTLKEMITDAWRWHQTGGYQK